VPSPTSSGTRWSASPEVGAREKPREGIDPDRARDHTGQDRLVVTVLLSLQHERDGDDGDRGLRSSPRGAPERQGRSRTRERARGRLRPAHRRARSGVPGREQTGRFDGSSTTVPENTVHCDCCNTEWSGKRCETCVDPDICGEPTGVAVRPETDVGLETTGLSPTSRRQDECGRWVCARKPPRGSAPGWVASGSPKVRGCSPAPNRPHTVR
jgi:hypothetical protein